MTHHAIPAFWKAYEALPASIREIADKSFALVKGDPRHPSLQLKKVGDYLVGTSYQADRALSIEVEDGLLWFWIGAHDAVRAVNQ